MAIIHVEGNIFNSEMQAIGHGVNTEGVMGSGIAKTVRELYPSVYQTYLNICLTTDLLNGGDHVAIWAQEHEISERWILNAASQEAQGRNAQYGFMESSLTKAFDWTSDRGFSGLALPYLGAGIGGLEWNDVLAIIENQAKRHSEIDVEVWKYVPSPLNYTPVSKKKK